MCWKRKIIHGSRPQSFTDRKYIWLGVDAALARLSHAPLLITVRWIENFLKPLPIHHLHITTTVTYFGIGFLQSHWTIFLSISCSSATLRELNHLASVLHLSIWGWIKINNFKNITLPILYFLDCYRCLFSFFDQYFLEWYFLGRYRLIHYIQVVSKYVA